ncbi:MAG: FRG domain-containing protein [Phycisphaerales bacterium]
MDVNLHSWKYFYDFVRQEMLDYAHYIWRGQRDSQWSLVSSIDRQLRNKDLTNEGKASEHLSKFKLSTRGRRGTNPAKIDDENEWWALGQHHGLATPLLDWTASPFVALYFAFDKPTRPNSGSRSVWALTGNVDEKNKKLVAESHKSQTLLTAGPAPILDLIRPTQDENARLVAQAGLFTKAPLGETVDEWVRKNYCGETSGAVIIKFVIPELGRTECLRTLNKMNINHLTLFLDIYGASLQCNKALEIDKY